MFTDVVGYTAMSSRDEGGALGLLGRYRSVLNSVFPKFRGRVVKTMGDGFLVEFASAVQAVNCAVQLQEEMGGLNSTLPSDRKIMVRVGIHVGDVVHAHGDILGDAVNVASRVEPLAEPGGICVTRQVVDQVEGKVDWRLTSMGLRQLRNLPNPVEVFAVGKAAMESVRSDEGRSRWVAILPFTNLSPDPNDKYFADGITEELISTVSRIRELSVISRASAMKYRDTSLPPRQVGQELGVGAILEGSVRKAGNKVRISAELIEVESDRYVWSQSYDRDLTDIFAVQGEIAQQVADGLRVQLLSGEKERLKAKQTENPEAYSLYLKGRFYWSERTEDGVKRAIRYFEEAIRADSDFAKAYSGMADAYLILSDYGWTKPAEAGRLAHDNAKKALALDPALAEAHASLGLFHVNHEWDFVKGEAEYKKALELNPNYASAYHWYSVLLFHLHRYEEALRKIERGAELDPWSMVIRQSVGVGLIGVGKFSEAIDMLNRVEEENQNLPSVHFWKMHIYLALAKFEEAIKEGNREVVSDNYSGGAMLDLAFATAEGGRKEEAARLLEDVLASEGKYQSPASVGAVMLALGKEGEAKEWLRRAIEERDSQLLYALSVPTYRKYASIPWWKEMVRSMGLPE